jgi:hypothetical protein
VIVTCAQPDTATFKALNPDWQHTVEVELLRSLEYTNRWLQWAKTSDASGETPKPAPSGKRPRNIPKPVPLPWDPAPSADESKPTAMTIDEANAWLGWSR